MIYLFQFCVSIVPNKCAISITNFAYGLDLAATDRIWLKKTSDWSAELTIAKLPRSFQDTDGPSDTQSEKKGIAIFLHQRGVLKSQTTTF